MSIKISDPIHIKDLDFRVQSINKGKYATLLIYKDARVDINRLNAVYGAGNWQRKHEVINGNLFCSIGLYHKESNSWAWVQDCGTESMTEKEKGQASDSFKRSGFNLGIGVELYDYPIISTKLLDGEWFLNEKKKDRFGNPTIQATFDFKLKDWVWGIQLDENNKVIYLKAFDNNKNPRFEFGKKDESNPVQLSNRPEITYEEFQKSLEPQNK